MGKPGSANYRPTRKSRRVPCYTGVEIQGENLAARGSIVNLSEDGVGLTVPIDALGHRSGASLRTKVELTFRLPGDSQPTNISARFVWVGSPIRDQHGHRAISLGLHFEPGQAPARARIKQVVDSYRYIVAVIGELERSVVEEAFAESYSIVWLSSLREIDDQPAGQLGLIVVGELPDTGDNSSLVTELVNGNYGDPQPPILYSAPALQNAGEKKLAAAGRFLYQPSPIEPLQLRSVGQRCVEGHILTMENALLNQELEARVTQLTRENEVFRGQAAPARHGGLVGESAAMQAVCTEIERVAQHDVSVVLLGETGTGKTMVARALHDISQRVHGPFVSQNCAAIAESLLDSELFGHSRGAFTGAVKNRDGLFVAANTGTIFLDEVAEMSPGMQAKLLDVLESGRVRRVGDNRATQVDVRIVCATHRDLPERVAAGSFREDLYFRLSAFVVRLPPLRERPEDIGPLALHFVGKAAARFERDVPPLSEEAVCQLEGYRWPGNVRQLRQIVDRLVLTCPRGGTIDGQAVGAALRNETGTAPASGFADILAAGGSLEEGKREFERRAIEHALRLSGGVVAEAARRLKVERTTLTRRCQRLGIRARRQD